MSELKAEALNCGGQYFSPFVPFRIYIYVHINLKYRKFEINIT